MPAPTLPDHRADEARTEVLGVYDSIRDAEWASEVLASHGITVRGLSLVEPSPTPARAADAAPADPGLAPLAALVRASARLYGWGADARRRSGRPVVAVLHGDAADRDAAERILADHAARFGRV